MKAFSNHVRGIAEKGARDNDDVRSHLLAVTRTMRKGYLPSARVIERRVSPTSQQIMVSTARLIDTRLEGTVCQPIGCRPQQLLEDGLHIVVAPKALESEQRIAT